jgi:hypothetical protein
MSEERWRVLEAGSDVLTVEERNKGYHFCPDWDYMLIGPDDLVGMTACLCNHKIDEEGE